MWLSAPPPVEGDKKGSEGHPQTPGDPDFSRSALPFLSTPSPIENPGFAGMQYTWVQLVGSYLNIVAVGVAVAWIFALACRRPNIIEPPSGLSGQPRK